MPNKTIYIRQADLPKWEALEDKSKHVSDMLNKLQPINVGAPDYQQFKDKTDE